MDEIHKIPGWEEYVIDLSRNPKAVMVGIFSQIQIKHRIIQQ